VASIDAAAAPSAATRWESSGQTTSNGLTYCHDNSPCRGSELSPPIRSPKRSRGVYGRPLQPRPRPTALAPLVAILGAAPAAAFALAGWGPMARCALTAAPFPGQRLPGTRPEATLSR